MDTRQDISTEEGPSAREEVSKETALSTVALHLANDLQRLAGGPVRAYVQEYCRPKQGPSGGCSKYSECDLHPGELKQTPIEEIEKHHPDAYQQLRDVGCLRCVVNEHRDEFRTANLAAGDFFGAVPDPPREAVQAAKLLAKHRCPYHGCVVPELAEIKPDASGAESPFEQSCPFGRSRTLLGNIEANPDRLSTCHITRGEVRELQRALAVMSISPVVIVPGADDGKPEVVYMGKNPLAPYQFLTIDPASLHSGRFQELRQAQARLHAPRLVRHSAESDHWTVGAFQTLGSLEALFEPEGLSDLERTIGFRYISAGEFAFLSLMWLWANETETPEDSSLQRVREVELENRTDLPKKDPRYLLTKLKDLGLGADVQSLYHELEERETVLVRHSSRLQDLELLGMLRANPDGDFQLTERASSFSEWFLDALAQLEGRPPQFRPNSLNVGRTRKLLWKEGHGQPTLREARDALAIGAITSDASKWLEGISALLASFDISVPRQEYRDMLWDTRSPGSCGFPVYPLVHFTLLARIESALDWIAVPTGAKVRIASPDAVVQHTYQAAAFVLAEHRHPNEVQQLVVLLQAILSAPVLAGLANWPNDALTRRDQQISYARKALQAEFVYESVGMQRVIKQCASTNKPVLITGDTGTGKRVVAKLIHWKSSRAKGPFREVNCGALPEKLVEDELFGHCKGAFSGADSERLGEFRSAHGGTLLLDEIGDMPVNLQVKLLHAIEHKQVNPLGQDKLVDIDVRIIAATNRDLTTALADGSFRKDLFYRLNANPIRLVPLHRRQEDIVPLAQGIVRRFNETTRANLTIDPGAKRTLEQYGWPGNIRELENVIEAAARQAVDEATSVIGPECIREQIERLALPEPSDSSSGRQGSSMGGGPEDQLDGYARKSSFSETEARQAAEVVSKIVKRGENQNIRSLDDPTRRKVLAVVRKCADAVPNANGKPNWKRLSQYFRLARKTLQDWYEMARELEGTQDLEG